MDSINSFKGYGKVDPVEEASFRKKTRRRLVILIVSVILLLVIIIGAVVGTLIHKNNNKKNNSSNPSTSSPSSAALKAVCNDTPYPDSCYSSISALGSQSHTADPQEIFKLSLQVLLSSLENLSTLPDTLLGKTNNDTLKRGLQVCQVVFDDAIDRLHDSISSITLQADDDNKKKKATTTLAPGVIGDLKTWLSTAITDQETCLDALEELNATALLAETKRQTSNSTQYASNSLSIVTKVLEILSNFGNIPIHRRRKLLGLQHQNSNGGFPEWVGSGDRRLLQEVKPKANVTVAKDGSGDVNTIREAVARIPKKSTTRFVIYVKAGEYVENNILDKSLWNVMIFGDGKDKTVVSASLNFVDGTPTFSTATFAAVGKGFIAKDMTFKNTAGPQKHQAVAFRSGSDFSVFYRCSFDAFQDTLYSHSNRQFYRECDITGTIDFIFGNAAVIYQNCNIQPRQPLANQFVTITAQGKKDPNQNTGISIQKCTISPLDTLTAPTYLGRPWKDFSTTIILQSTIGPFLNPAGWIAWVNNVEPPSTIFYAEYQNTGPGATLDKRVKWAGYRTNITAKDASRFTVQNFIQGSQWISETNVIFESNL